MREKETAVRDRYTVMITLLCTACLALLILIAFALSKPEEEQHIPAPEMNAEGLCTVTVKHMPQPTEAEILAMAQAMSGECYENEYGDMLKVGMAICNRVDYSGGMYSFPDTIQGVCAQPGQIYGYDPSRRPKDIYTQAAREVLSNWYGIKNGEARPWEPGIKFWSGFGGTKNTFREDYQ